MKAKAKSLLVTRSTSATVKKWRGWFFLGKIPSGYKIDLGFQDKYVPKDGPSAATVFTLLLDSLITGEEIDEKFAATGDITADGMVQKIGGTSGKIRGATKRGCKIVGVPEGNGKDIADVLLMDGPEQLLDIQIFTMKDFDEAHAISRAKKSDAVQSTLDAFDAIVAVCKEKASGSDPKTKYDAILKNPATITRLHGILDKMPNHHSARLLIDYAEGKNSKSLSIAGTFQEIQVATSAVMSPIGRAMMFHDEDEPLEIESATVADAKESVKTLSQLKEHIDPRLEKYLTSTIAVCQLIADGKKEMTDKKYFESIKEAFDNIRNVYSKLQGDPAIMEELNE